MPVSSTDTQERIYALTYKRQNLRAEKKQKGGWTLRVKEDKRKRNSKTQRKLTLTGTWWYLEHDRQYGMYRVEWGQCK